MAKKKKSSFVCSECGYDTPKWFGKCPSCGEWGSLKEFTESRKTVSGTAAESRDPVKLGNIEKARQDRISTGISEMDRVLGGGFLRSMAALIGGDPGIGKSTLMLKLAANICDAGMKVLYVSGEESPDQIRTRAERISAWNENMYVFCENDLTNITAWMKANSPELVIIDSIQTVYDPENDSSPGSPAQIRSTASELIMHAKKTGCSIFLIGHVTKDGYIAGPKMIEHMVDTVLYFEGDRFHTFRLLRTVKNRFGSTNEIGIFEMGSEGLKEVLNPSQYFLEADGTGNPGSSITASLEGTRPILVEIQALVSDPAFGNPQRNCVGFDFKRLNKIIAVLDKKIGIHITGQDVFLNITGGVRLNDPGADISVAVSLISSFRNLPVPKKSVFIGETGLNGEIRAVSGIEQRINESLKLGFEKVFVPYSCRKTKRRSPEGVIYVKDLQELISYLI